MELFIVRHGEALPESIDPERSLSRAGISEITEVAGVLKNAGARAGTIFFSTKKRAEETARIISGILETDSTLVEREDMSPSSPVEPVMDMISRAEKNIMIVGHMPFVGKLAKKLLGNAAAESIHFETGSVLCLTKKDGAWNVEYSISPERK